MADYVPSNLDLAITLVSQTTVTSVLHTLSFVLYCLCVRLLYLQPDGKINRQTARSHQITHV
jgi:hypothetical protein